MGLRQAIATHLEQFRGMHVQPEQIFIGAGTEYLYGLLIQLLGFDKKYAIENPGYEFILEKASALGYELVSEVELDRRLRKNCRNLQQLQCGISLYSNG